ncbi:kelch domain-containing protein 9 [Hemicordylus capensis]|uniref:kelch domain-containing protein 9 n=1 Tax=Hemicordylus capensis TaxID=884348 RepID=UPI002302DDF3|nr:kelch domain-containing protein 9 [Hemicordylus capensis]XP_053134775.1 kelch domain-containing protein 9 [Hemicordylus capensis]XP_053134776.1 kelch domain-containing protein 9 [Hemicordylus capensis]
MTAASSRWEWKPVVRSDLLARGFHSCNVVQGQLLIFGGLKSPETQDPPLGDIVAFEPALQTVRTLAPECGYGRSHHEALALADRWLCVVGGWDGSRRVSDVGAFDAERGQWERWTEGPSNEAPVGLSSHTCTKLTDHEARVVGREGGLRTQRRYASIFTLRVNPSAKTYWYKEEESRTASRAGHSAMLLQDTSSSGKSSGYKLVVFGGRDSADFDVAGRWGKGKIHVDSAHAPGLVDQISRLLSTEKGSQQAPKGLRHQSCTVVGPFAVIFGGETLARGRDAVCNDLYIYDTRSSPANWFRFPGSSRAQKRVGHRTCLWNDKLYLAGGFGADGKTPCPEISTLEIAP